MRETDRREKKYGREERGERGESGGIEERAEIGKDRRERRARYIYTIFLKQMNRPRMEKRISKAS